MRLKGRTILISGASRGLGAALARRYVEEGAAVSLCARSEELEDVRAGLRDHGEGCLAVRADVTVQEDVDRWIEATAGRFGEIHALVNNASILGPRASIEAYPADAWRDVLEANLTGAFRCARAAIPHLRRTRGSIVNV